MGILIKKASEILTMTDGIGLIKDGSILIEDGIIKQVGNLDICQTKFETIDARGWVIMPGFVDAHTHLVFAGTREDEFAMRIAGKKYEKIAKEGGGIANTVFATRKATEDELYKLAQKRISNLIKEGTTTVEIKSGYGLSLSEEMKILRIIKKLKENSPIDIIPTYLVHTVPLHMKIRDYVDLVTEEIIPEVVQERLALFCDIFCDKTAFNNKESEKILKRAKEFEFKLKIHADELSNSGGAKLAAKLGCVSADHLIYTTKTGIKDMKNTGVIPVLLPGTSLFLKIRKKPKIEVFNKLKMPVAISSDFNPGTCMIYSMPKIISLACILYGMTIEKAFEGATANSARALDLFGKIGIIRPGAQADLVIFDIDHYRKIVYQFGEDFVMAVIKKGKIIYEKNR